MLEILLFVLGSGAVNAGNKHFKEQKRLDHALSVCRDCQTENPIAAKFCKKCRSQNLIRRKEFNIEKQRMLKENLKTQEQHNALLKRVKCAKEYYTFAVNSRYCPECVATFDPTTWHCTSCGCETELVSSDTVFSWMQLNYPDLIENPKDVECLAAFQPEEAFTVGKAIIKTGSMVGKVGLWAGKKIISSIGRELDKK